MIRGAPNWSPKPGGEQWRNRRSFQLRISWKGSHIMHFTKKQKVAAALGAGAVAIAGGGVALAYFPDTGSGSSAGAVGSSSNWGVSVTVDKTATLYPGVGSQPISYTITNNGSGHQGLKDVKVTVSADANGDVTNDALVTPASAVGCKASWFTV